MADDLNNKKMDKLSVEDATHFKIEEMMQSFSGILAAAMQENYENEGMAVDTVTRLNNQFSQMQTFFKEKVEPTIALFKFAFSGPENPKACKIIPLGRGKKKNNILGESHAQAKWLTTMKRMGDLKVCRDRLLEKKQSEAMKTHQKKNSKVRQGKGKDCGNPA